MMSKEQGEQMPDDKKGAARNESRLLHFPELQSFTQIDQLLSETKTIVW